MTDDFNVIITDPDGSITVVDSQNTVTSSTSVSVISGQTYVHSQGAASNLWTIMHNLSRRPSVTVVDSGGNVQIGEVLYVSDNEVRVYFVSAFGGYAYLN